MVVCSRLPFGSPSLRTLTSRILSSVRPRAAGESGTFAERKAKGKDPGMRLGEIARALDLALEGDADIEIRALAPVDTAGEGDLTFVAAPRYRRYLAASRAS